MQLEITHVGAVHDFGLTRLPEPQDVSNYFNAGPTPFHFNTFPGGSLFRPTIGTKVPLDTDPGISGHVIGVIDGGSQNSAGADVKGIKSTRLGDVIIRAGRIAPERIGIGRVFAGIDFVGVSRGADTGRFHIGGIDGGLLAKEEVDVGDDDNCR